MPCTYSAVNLKEKRATKKKTSKKRKAAQKKQAIITALAGMGFKLSSKSPEKGQLLLLGQKESKQIEVAIDEATGKFVTHFTGVPTHNEEHQILDAFLAELVKLGFESSVDHYHSRPKLPEFDALLSEPERERAGV